MLDAVLDAVLDSIARLLPPRALQGPRPGCRHVSNLAYRTRKLDRTYTLRIIYLFLRIYPQRCGPGTGVIDILRFILKMRERNRPTKLYSVVNILWLSARAFRVNLTFYLILAVFRILAALSGIP